MDAAAFNGLREIMGLSHEEMAKRFGLKIEEYLALEGGTRRPNKLQTLAYERLALGAAADHKNPDIAPPGIRRAALRLGEIVLQQNRPPVGSA